MEENGYIICVDDQPVILDALTSQLERTIGDLCEIETAESAEEALEVLEDLHQRGKHVEMVISDEVMPGMKGSQLLELVHKRDPEIIKIMLTGQAGLDAVAYAINHAGLHKYFPKPWQYEDFHLTIKNLLEKNRLNRKNRHLTQELHDQYQELKATYQKLSLAYTQLQDAQDQLIHAEKLSLLGQLSTGIVHEVKNQLSVLGFAELIQQDYPDDTRLQMYACNILKAGRNIYTLVEEIRRFAKKESRQYEMERISLPDLLDRLLHFMRFDTLLAYRKITTAYESVPWAFVNEDKFGQVMINLLRNAAQATPTTSGEIKIRVAATNRHAMIEVQDTGCGIADTDLEKIWDPFFTTKGEEGTGLGLEICKRIIEEHQGTITCASQVNIGTTFTISLPLAQDISC
ncbi:response regulator [candidate division KSB3 bacterium]|uniref:histidine kinase n=1 Tax=candidate division KSB3 bacterium TaxID=2044937 RepID=A0A9D5K024_9BACT|nr:response regulator [candidate division KSB3 bacterium]MBD3327310.1 response regulator [candidate division KSB3 bacterium]